MKKTPFEFTPENYKQVDEILSHYPSNYKQSAIIPLLMLAQKQNKNYLPLSAMNKIAKIVETPAMAVYEVATFYTMFNREKMGKYHLQVCGTTPCMLRGAEVIIKAIEDHLGITKNHTTSDGLFTLNEVECLGACVNAPMMQINNEHFFEDLTPENTVILLKQLAIGDEHKLGPQIDRNFSEGPEGRTSLKDPERVIHDRDFDQAKKEWVELKEKQKLEQQKK